MTPTRKNERRVCSRTDPGLPPRATESSIQETFGETTTTTTTHQTTPQAAAHRPIGASWVASRTKHRGMAEARHDHPLIHRNLTHSRPERNDMSQGG